MIGSLRGNVQEISGEMITLDVSGVGYEVTCTQQLLARLNLGKSVQITVHTDVKEDAIRLFGFDDRAERQVFSLLLKVNGLGPRSALDVVSRVDKQVLLRAIGAGDVTALMNVKGIGKKKAERIVLELKDIVADFSFGGGSQEFTTSGVSRPTGLSDSGVDAISALEALGCNRKDAERAVREALGKIPPASEVGIVVREALQFI